MKTLLALLALSLSLPAIAAEQELETVFEWQNVTDSKQEKAHSFRCGEKVDYTLTVSLDPSRKRAKPIMRLKLLSIDAEGRETEIKKYRVQLEEKTKPTKEEVKLDPGRYIFRLEVDDADYLVKLERPKQG